MVSKKNLDVILCFSIGKAGLFQNFFFFLIFCSLKVTYLGLGVFPSVNFVLFMLTWKNSAFFFFQIFLLFLSLFSFWYFHLLCLFLSHSSWLFCWTEYQSLFSWLFSLGNFCWNSLKLKNYFLSHVSILHFCDGGFFFGIFEREFFLRISISVSCMLAIYLLEPLTYCFIFLISSTSLSCLVLMPVLSLQIVFFAFCYAM